MKTTAASMVLIGSLMLVSMQGQQPAAPAATKKAAPEKPIIPGQRWPMNTMTRPMAPEVAPPTTPGQPPADAIILFDGKDLSKFISARGGGEPKWKVENGYVEIVPGTGDLLTKEKFGDVQLHAEWASPAEVKGDSQNRGNSGFKLMRLYEIQVLDSVNNPTYADGAAGSIYGQWPPMVNVSRKPGEWQSYDLIFETPTFNDQGTVVKQGAITLLHNGVVVQHAMKLTGATSNGVFVPHSTEEPLLIQDHNSPVRYRNIWIRRIPAGDKR